MVRFAGYGLQLDELIRNQLKDYKDINILEMVDWLKEVDDNADINSFGESIIISAEDFKKLSGIALDIVGMVESLGNEVEDVWVLVGEIIRSANISTCRG